MSTLAADFRWRAFSLHGRFTQASGGIYEIRFYRPVAVDLGLRCVPAFKDCVYGLCFFQRTLQGVDFHSGFVRERFRYGVDTGDRVAVLNGQVGC